MLCSERRSVALGVVSFMTLCTPLTVAGQAVHPPTDSAVIAFWEWTAAAARGGVRCLDARERDGCQRMAEGFASADSVARSLGPGAGRVHVIISGQKFTLSEGAEQLLLLGETVVRAQGTVVDTDRMYLVARLRSVLIDSHVGRQRVREPRDLTLPP